MNHDKPRLTIRATDALGMKVPKPRGIALINTDNGNRWFSVTGIKLSWRDRLRVLFGRRLEVRLEYEGPRSEIIHTVATIDTIRRRKRHAVEGKHP